MTNAQKNLPTEFLEILNTLVRCPSVVGHETPFFRVLQRELDEVGIEATWYEGLLVAKGNAPDSIMFSAHIDRHGLICTGPNEFQYAAFVAGSRSDLLGNSVTEELMHKIVDRFQGDPVFAYEPWSGAYLGRGKIEDAYICEYRNNLIFELAGLEGLVAGTPVAFDDRLHIKDECLVAQLDNVISAAALIYLYKCGFQGTAFFSAQEEAGKSWRYLLEWFRRFGNSKNHLIVLDTSPYANQNEANQQHLVLRHKDANGIFSEQLTSQIQNICEQNDITYQFKDSYIEQLNAEAEKKDLPKKSLGSTEMGRIVLGSIGLVEGTTLQIPTSGYHTTQESASITSVTSFLKVLKILGNIV